MIGWELDPEQDSILAVFPPEIKARKQPSSLIEHQKNPALRPSPAQSQDMHIPVETEIQKQYTTNKTQSVTMPPSHFGLVPSPEQRKNT